MGKRKSLFSVARLPLVAILCSLVLVAILAMVLAALVVNAFCSVEIPVFVVFEMLLPVVVAVVEETIGEIVL
jgi:hypothetical protein